MIAFAAALLMQAPPANPAPAHPRAAPSFEVLSRQAAEARDAKRPAEALALYRKALKLKPDWAEGLWESGSIEYDLDQYKECAADFRRLATLRPDQPPGWIMAGLCEYHLPDYEAALKDLLQMQKLGFQRNDLTRAGRLHLVLVLIKLGRFETAIAKLFELTHDTKMTPEIMVAAGIAGLREPWTPPEVPEAERDKVFKLGEAMATAMGGDTKGAVEKFDVVVRDYPKDPNVHFRYGALLMRGQDEERGIQEIGKALELQPDHLPALVSLASIYLKRDQLQTAREYAEKAVKLAPADFATHVELGRVLREADDTEGAVREFETAVRLAPESPESHYDLASVYAKLGRTEDARRERVEFRRLRKITDPNQP
jgi:tetratricopeptide (TPR) repeat protein